MWLENEEEIVVGIGPYSPVVWTSLLNIRKNIKINGGGLYLV